MAQENTAGGMDELRRFNGNSIIVVAGGARAEYANAFQPRNH
jgi:hypothetical protein